MNDREFVEEFYILKKSLMDDYFSNKKDPARAALVAKVADNKEQEETVHKIIDLVLTDALYTILLGIDGCATIGEEQQLYKLFDEEGNEMTNNNIESYAWEIFQDQ
ncbi:MAG: hypothetical protein AB2697_10540 [Candidatus Thiodiazotropha endolucinida]